MSVQLLDVLGEEEINKLLSEQDKIDEQEPDEPLRCDACGHPVTHPKERITLGGSHAHTCTNPRGIRFRLGCFREAPGCGQIGEETLEHTWFPGYAWRIALCNGCGVHLGWGFRARDGERFFGLILDRLAGTDGAG